MAHIKFYPKFCTHTVFAHKIVQAKCWANFPNYSDEVGTILDFPFKEEIKDGITPPKALNLDKIQPGGPSGGFCFAKSGFMEFQITSDGRL